MVIIHGLYFLAGLALIWLASGLVISGVERFSRDTRISRFAASFLIYKPPRLFPCPA